MISAWPVIVILALRFPLYWQEPAAELGETEVHRPAQKYFTSVRNDPSLSSPVSEPNIRIMLETTNLDTKRAKAQIGFQKGDTIFHIKLEGPLGSGADQATWADLNGLANSVVADIGLSGFLWDPKPDTRLRRAIDRCRTDFLKTHTEKEWEDLIAKEGGFNPDNLPGECKKYLKGSYGTPLQWGVRVQLGREKYTYLDPADYEERKLVRTNMAFVLYNGILLPEYNLFLGLSYRYQSAHKAGEPEKILVPISEKPGALRLHELPVGAPILKSSNFGQLEARHFFNAQFGWNPRITYDFNNRILGIELPFYFMKSAKEGLNGGVSAGWRSDKKEWGLRFFIGNAFKIFRD